MIEFPGRARSAYLGTIDIGTGCTSALPRGTLSTCRSDTPILGSGHVRLYPLDTVPTSMTGIAIIPHVLPSVYSILLSTLSKIIEAFVHLLSLAFEHSYNLPPF